MQRFRGLAAADGIVVGKVFLLDAVQARTPRHEIAPAAVVGERLRFERAVNQTELQLQALSDKLRDLGGDTLILEAHKLILRDPHLFDRVLERIECQRINAEWAVEQTVAEIRQVFEQATDRRFRERASDITFTGRQLLAVLKGAGKRQVEVPEDAVIFAHDIGPAEAVQFYRQGAKGFVTAVGGVTSHMAIVARSLRIPAVVGLQGIVEQVNDGQPVIVDGHRGKVVIEPDPSTVERWQRVQRKREEVADRLREQRDKPPVTRDGHRIRLLANIELREEVPFALEQGADGIGLYRTEFVYLGQPLLPSEQQHLENTVQLLEACDRLPVTVRSCDLGADTMPSYVATAAEHNPALGLRSLRFCLRRPEIFRTQLRGLMRASATRPFRLMFPKVSGVEELREAKQILARCVAELRAEGRAVREVELGIMVEMPSAAVIADLLAPEVDFFSIGTNDLIQYVLAVDRLNEQVNDLYHPLHPAILRLIRLVVAAGARAGIPVTVCGEMAGDPLMVPVLLGLGVRELSMHPAAVPAVRRAVRAVTLGEARQLADRILGMGTVSAIESEVYRTVNRLFSEEQIEYLLGKEEELSVV